MHDRFLPGDLARRSRFLSKFEKTILWDSRLMGAGHVVHCIQKTDVVLVLCVVQGAVLVHVDRFVGWGYEYEFEKL